MPRKKAKEVEASTEETKPVEEETPEIEEAPEVPSEEIPKVEEAEEAPKTEPAPCVPCGKEASVEVLPTIKSIAPGATFEFQGLLLSKEGTQGRLVVGSYLNNPVKKLLFAPETPVKPK